MVAEFPFIFNFYSSLIFRKPYVSLLNIKKRNLEATQLTFTCSRLTIKIERKKKTFSIVDFEQVNVSGVSLMRYPLKEV